MNKTKLLTVLMLFFISVNAQETPTNIHLSQDFSGSFETDGWTIENYTTQWTKENSSNAGGDSPELRFEYTNGTSTTRFISPSIDLTSITDLSLSFKQFVDHYGSGYTIGVATRSNQGTWNTVWTTSPTNDIGPETNDLIIDNGDVGSSDFQFCFFLSGNAYQIDYWYIDDISLFTPFNLDLSVSSINLDKYISSGTVTPAATVKNEGLNGISSFDIKYQINGGEIISESISDITINRGESYVHTFNQTWNATAGNYEFLVSISSINAETSDDNDTNNEKVKSLSIASQTVTNLPIFESFTSSTCPPCFTFNTSTFTPFLNSHTNEFAIIKYQMSWPSPGDPYYNDEGGVRRSFYGVSAVPTLMTGGEVTGTNSTDLNTNFNYQAAKDAFFSIEATAIINGTTINTEIEVTPYITVEGFNLHAAIVEKETTGNASTNGETSFKYVMMKMLPDALGTVVNFEDGHVFSISYSQNLQETYIEEYDDLYLVVFIQNDETKEIFQSKMIEINPKILTFGFEGISEADVDISDIENNFATITVTVASGVDITSLTPTITITEGATINPAPNNSVYQPIDFSNQVSFEVSAGSLTNTYNVIVDVETNVNTKEYLPLLIYPNPTNGNFTIEIPAGAGMASVEVFTTTGSLVYSKNFSNSIEAITMNIGQPQGVYMLKVTLQDGKTSVSKLVIR